MLRKATRTNLFKRRAEEGQNPYIGFLSFQHFRGEKLYSDIVVKPENKFCETERVECYPVSPDADERGREEGYYPDTTVAYIRVLWKEFESERGVYNYKFIEDILNNARLHGQTVMFRLMAHSTRACDDVPEWLKTLVDCPARPEWQRVKDSPTDPLFIELFCEAVRKLGERFDSDPTLDIVDISLPGAWGEGHNLELYPKELLTQLVDTYVSVFKKTRLMSQITKPELVKYAGKTLPVGVRGDGFGSPKHIFEAYPKRMAALADTWMSAPISFEAYWWLGEWKRQGWDIDKIIELSLSWHVSTFNAKSLPIPIEWKGKVDEWISKMGYHFAIDSFSHPETAEGGDTLSLVLAVDNVGVAPIYRPVFLNVRLVGEREYEYQTDVKVTDWLPGKHEEKIEIQLPSDIPSGVYQIEIGIFGENVPFLYLATDAPRNDKYYTLCEIKIT